MFELSVACKYLIPRWRQLSVSIISIVSILVIALVVWLIVVFFSVKDGLENSWIEKLIALTAPIRITPTEKYYNSYYYLVDSFSSKSEYSLKSLREKLDVEASDPYDPDVDEELPVTWQPPDRDADGSVKDLVKLAYFTAAELPEAHQVKVSDFEMTAANLRLRMLRTIVKENHDAVSNVNQTEQFIDQAAYIGTYDADTPAIAKTLVPLSSEDLHNIIRMEASYNRADKAPGTNHEEEKGLLRKRLKRLFDSVSITALKSPPQGWVIPRAMLSKHIDLAACIILKNGQISGILIPQTLAGLPSLLRRYKDEGFVVERADVSIGNGIVKARTGNNGYETLSPSVEVKIEAGALIDASLIRSSLDNAEGLSSIRFHIRLPLQGTFIEGEVGFGQLEVAAAHVEDSDRPQSFAIKASNGSKIITSDDAVDGEHIIIPRSFKEGGVLAGDRGYLSYQSATPSSVQEQRIPVYVAGFYDPGIMPIGGKFILTGHHVADAIRSAQNHDEALFSNGFNMRFDNLSDVQAIKTALISAYQKKGVDAYWNVETYQEYEFTKDLIQQLQSEKNLFGLISMVIIIVACSNIISMLIILVNDKKVEIGILRSMGASSWSIATIFGLCGMVMGAFGSIIGIAAAVLTLNNLDFLVGWLGRMQGHALFNPLFYGNTLPNTISWEALGFVVMATALVSLLAGIVPAVKASLLSPSSILRSE